MLNSERDLRLCTANRPRICLAMAWAVLAGVTAVAQQGSMYSGVVLDARGAAIANARIELHLGDSVVRARTDNEGRFVIERPLTATESRPAVTLVFHANGFASQSIKVPTAASAIPLEIRLQPAPLVQRIDIDINEEETTAAGVGGEFTLIRSRLNAAGALAVDDVLRQVPGFSLFRRSGSLTANPTSQGVSLRGVGANGASRALVFLDGVPLNTPFGNWVYWNRISRSVIQSVEIRSGAVSDAYGSGALGGTINIRTRAIDTSSLEADVSVGNLATLTASATGSLSFDRWAISASAQGLRTRGYVLVPPSVRGDVDTLAGTSDFTGSLVISRSFAPEGRAFVRLNSFGESRQNGTRLQVNNTRIWSLDLGLDFPATKIGDLAARLYGSGEVFNQAFSAVAADRNSESLTNRQRNPSQQLGFAIQSRRVFGFRHATVLGAEGRSVRGHSAETTFNGGRATAFIDAGGRQEIWGVFGQDAIHFHGWLLVAGARFDRWLNSSGFADRVPVAGAPSFAKFVNRSDTAVSPRVTISHAAGSHATISGSFYRAFRAPTLNELFRGFRVGNIVTNANADLRAEHLTGAELGITFNGLKDRVTACGSFFHSQINDPIANVTLTSTPALITRQRQNLGAIRARGFEASAEIKATDRLTVSAAYLLTASRILRFPVNPALEGLWVPQIPRHQFNFQLTFANPKWTAGIQGRFNSSQFDDDLNLLPLHRYFTLDAEGSRTVSRHVQLFVAAQNLLGSRYEIGRTPVLTTGPPALVRVGARLNIR